MMGVGIKNTSGKPRIAFIAEPGEFSFLDPIIKNLSVRYETKVFPGNTAEELYDIMQWSDVSWFEWCKPILAYVTQRPKICKIICRLHSYEMYTGTPSMVRWGGVDRLIFVANHIKEKTKRLVPFLEEKVETVVIPNGVDVDNFAFKDRKPGYNIAFVGDFRPAKNIPLLLQCFKEIVNLNPKYKLHIVGRCNDDYPPALEIKDYFDHIVKLWHLEKNITFYGFIKDINNWLEDKNFIISTSIRESQGMGIMEAMARGIKPIVHYFPGANEIYPEKYLFETPEEFRKLVSSKDYKSIEYKEFIDEHYSSEKQLKTLNKLVEDLIRE
ncbi:MAG: glycosyltransferase family 4 protein [bacterium]|nr:glycosyltransferase family 4 protein [bacterium]